MTSHRCAIVVTAAGLTWAVTADAVLTPAQKCEVAKNKASGKKATSLAGERT